MNSAGWTGPSLTGVGRTLYIRTYAHTHIRIYTHTHIRTYTHTHIRTYVHTHIRTVQPYKAHTIHKAHMYSAHILNSTRVLKHKVGSVHTHKSHLCV